MCDKSFVYWYPSLEKHLCGYCKNECGNVSHGMWAKYLTVEDYQNLIDRGWRRSGHYCYKPLMDQICCPMYTIKCDALNFQLSKSQKKVIKKFNKFLKDGQLNNSEKSQEQHDSAEGVSEFYYREAPLHVCDVKSDEISDAVVADVNDESTKHDSIAGQSQVYTKTNDVAKLAQPKSGVGADPNKPPCKKAKVLRMERRQEKLLKRGMSLEKIPSKNEQKTLEEFLSDIPQDQKHKLKLELVDTSRRDEEWERLKIIEFELYKKYQMTIHNDPPGKCTMEGFLRFLVKSPLQITLERLHASHKHFKLTADLFRKYQIFVHNEKPDDCDENQYVSFLIDTPLQHVARDSELGFGSFHQLYWLDDKLVAVGVIDILPKCVSAVYFFYDPDYRSLTLGTYGSLREVEFVRSLHQKIPSIEYYYMGYYIHSCPKMRYKGKLTPSFLLCPETYHWVPIEKCLSKLEVDKYSKLQDDEAAVDDNMCSSDDVDGIKIWYNRKIILLKQFKKKYEVEDLFNTIGQLIGQNCSKSLIFISDH